MLRCNPSLGWNSICWCFTTIISCLAKNSKILGGGFKMMIISDSWCKNLSSRVFFFLPSFSRDLHTDVEYRTEWDWYSSRFKMCTTYFYSVSNLVSRIAKLLQHCLASKIAEMVATKGTFCAIRPKYICQKLFL